MIVKNKEEFLLFARWFTRIIAHHNIQSSIEIKLRERVAGMEVDMIVTSARLRIGFEFKESDIVKAVQQAVKRRPHFDYFYIVLDASVGWILQQLAYYELTKDIVENGIGVVSARDDTVVWYSYKPDRAQIYRSIIDLLNTCKNGNQVSL